MLTRVNQRDKARLKKLVAELDFGLLNAMHEELLVQFLREKPWKHGVAWCQPAPKGEDGWSAQNVVVGERLQKQVKAVAAKEEVSLTTLLHTAIKWWIQRHKP
jgi:hypothetical protein